MSFLLSSPVLPQLLVERNFHDPNDLQTLLGSKLQPTAATLTFL